MRVSPLLTIADGAACGRSVTGSRRSRSFRDPPRGARTGHDVAVDVRRFVASRAAAATAAARGPRGSGARAAARGRSRRRRRPRRRQRCDVDGGGPRAARGGPWRLPRRPLRRGPRRRPGPSFAREGRSIGSRKATADATAAPPPRGARGPRREAPARRGAAAVALDAADAVLEDGVLERRLAVRVVGAGAGAGAARGAVVRRVHAAAESACRGRLQRGERRPRLRSALPSGSSRRRVGMSRSSSSLAASWRPRASMHERARTESVA